MEQYIPKSALVAEIDRQKIGYNVDGKHSIEYDTTRKILNIIDTLEVKEVSMPALDNGNMPVERWKEACKAASSQANYRKSKGLTETCDDYFVDGVQWADEHPKEEPVSIWHDAGKKPERDDLLIETNDRRIIHRQSINNYGMVKRWAYTSDLLNLSNVQRTIKDWKEEPVSEDLEKAANEYADGENPTCPCEECLIKTFKAGAEWQKKQDQSTIELAEDHAMLAGMEKMEQQMIEKAIDGQLENGEDYLRIKCLSTGCQPQDDGKLVKLIIIKED